MMDGIIAAIDQGTTSTRCILFDHSGKIISISQKEHTQIFPKPGWVEHDPLEIWKNTREVIVDAVHKSGLLEKSINAFGITNQRETTFLWNKKTGIPLCNAIVWQDTRTDTLCNHYAREGGSDRFREKTGLPLATYFSGPKITWLFENVPGVQEAAANGDLYFGNADSWIIWNLTGGVNGGLHITDVTNASRTMLMDLSTLEWDQEILATFGIPESILPKIMPSSMVYGESKDPFVGIPVASDFGDQQAALFGQTCFEAGEVKNTYGTGCFMLMNTGKKAVVSKNGLLTTVGYKISNEPAVFCLEGSIAVTGSLVQWLRDNLKIISTSKEVETLARSVEDNGDVYFVPAFSGLFAPYWRSDARGVIVGLTRFVNSGHIARAALEATAFQTKEVIDAMEIDSGVRLTALKVDGGMVYNGLLMQFQADVLQVPVIRPSIAETTALGAAYGAGLAVGYWCGLSDLKQNWIKDYEWQPEMDKRSVDQRISRWKKAVKKSFNWVDEPPERMGNE
jgi:glycerol kinase